MARITIAGADLTLVQHLILKPPGTHVQPVILFERTWAVTHWMEVTHWMGWGATPLFTIELIELIPIKQEEGNGRNHTG